MSEQALGVQGKILMWARERAGLSREAVASAMHKDVSTIEEWESGIAAPTYVQMERLAYTLYKRPLAVFFFPEPPDEEDPRKSFRTLPDADLDSLDADTRYALRYGQSLQLALKELNDGRNPSDRRIFGEISLAGKVRLEQTATRVREYLGVTLEEQFRWQSTEAALRAWRDRVETAGLFVFKRSFKQKDISGFCIYDPEFPIVYLNNSNPKTRQIFSLFHELSHILLHMSGIGKLGSAYIKALTRDAREIEINCNGLAAEILVPSKAFSDLCTGISPKDEKAIMKLAMRFRVSREVILRRFLDKGLVDQSYYEAKVSAWTKEALARKGADDTGGGNYYKTQVAYLGDRYLKLVFGKYYQGHLTVEQVADYFGIKSASVSGIEHEFAGRATTA